MNISMFRKKKFIVFITMLLSMCIITYWKFITFQEVFFINSVDSMTSFINNIININNIIYSGEFPMWSFAKGLGKSVTVATPNVIGDWFIFLLALLPKDYIIDGLGWVQFFKTFFAGVLFYIYLSNIKINEDGKIIFSLLYAFNGVMLIRGPWIHYATEVVMMPLFLIGLEKYYKNKNKLLFPIVFALLLASRGAMYIYIYSLFSYFYIILRKWFDDGFSIRELFIVVIRFTPYYCIGLLISGFMVLPGIYNLIYSSRLNSSGSSLFTTIINSFSFVNLEKISATFSKLFSPSITGYFTTKTGNVLEDNCFYSGLFTLCIIPTIFFKKSVSKDKKVVSGFILAIILIYSCTNFLRYFLNAFLIGHYKTSSFWVNVCLIILAAYAYSNEEKSDSKILKTSCSILILILVSIMMLKSDILISQSVIALFFLISIYMIYSQTRIKKGYALIVSCICEILVFSHLAYTQVPDLPIITKSNYSDIFGKYKSLSTLKPDNTNFYRISRIDNKYYYFNLSMVYNYYGLSEYDSSISSSIQEMEQYYNIVTPTYNILSSVDDNYLLSTLLNTKYKVNIKEKLDLNNYTYKYTNADGVNVYENNLFIPFGIFYDKISNKSIFDNLNQNQKDLAVLNSALVHQEDYESITLPKYFGGQGQEENINLLLNKSHLNNVSLVSNEGTDVTYKCIGVDPQVVYDVHNNKLNSLYLNFYIDSDEETTMQVFYTDDHEGFTEEKSYYLNIGKGLNNYDLSIESNDPIKRIRFDLGNIDKAYTISDITTSVPYSKSDMLKLFKNGHMNIQEFSNNKILGIYDAKTSGIMFFSIPFDKGWSVKVDGIRKEMINVNAGLSGVFIKEGNHTVELRYVTPGLYLGFALSLFGIVIINLVKIKNLFKNRKV